MANIVQVGSTSGDITICKAKTQISSSIRPCFRPSFKMRSHSCEIQGTAEISQNDQRQSVRHNNKMTGRSRRQEFELLHSDRRHSVFSDTADRMTGSYFHEQAGNSVFGASQQGCGRPQHSSKYHEGGSPSHLFQPSGPQFSNFNIHGAHQYSYSYGQTPFTSGFRQAQYPPYNRQHSFGWVNQCRAAI